MPRFRFEVAAIALAIICIALYSGVVLYRSEAAPPTLKRQIERNAAPEEIRSDLCGIAKAQRSYFQRSGSFASADELRSKMGATFQSRWPYNYSIQRPTPDRFIAIALFMDTSLHGHPPAITVDESTHVCTLKARVPDFRWTIDHPRETWGAEPDYDCEECPYPLPQLIVPATLE